MFAIGRKKNNIVGFSKEPIFIIYGSFDKKKLKMKDYTNPVGSIDEGLSPTPITSDTPSVSPGSLTNPTFINYSSAQPNEGKEYYEVIGRGGSVRHTGYFSSNNPYLSNLKAATKNQDKDALYELAVKWEADYANTQESREYNSPSAQVSRNREAGINSDIVGASSSGSAGSPGSAGSAIPQQQTQTKFSNVYDNISATTQVINSVVSSAESLTGLVQTMGTMADVFSISHNAAARDRIMTQNMPNVLSKEGITQADTERRRAENVSQMYDAWSNVVSNFNFADDTKPSDAEFENLFQSLGLFEEGQRTQFRNWISSPNAIKEIKTAQLAKNKAKAQELAWNYDALLRQAQLDVAFKISTLEADAAFSSIRSIFAGILSENADTLASNGATSIIDSVATDASSAKVERGIAEQELKRFRNFTDHQTSIISYLDNQMKELKDIGLTTNEKRYLYNQLSIAKKQILDMGFAQFSEMYTIYQTVVRGTFSGLEYLGDDGEAEVDDPITRQYVKDFYNLASGGTGSAGSINPFSMAFDLAKIIISKKFKIKTK